MFHEDERIRAGGAHGLNRLNTKVYVLVGDVLGLIAVEVVVTVFRVLCLYGLRRHVTQIPV